MKKTILFLLILFVFQISFGQKFHFINLTNEDINIPNRNFYIDSIIDNRIDQTKIGIVQKGVFNVKYNARFENGFYPTLNRYFENSLPKEKEQIPLIIKINKH